MVTTFKMSQWKNNWDRKTGDTQLCSASEYPHSSSVGILHQGVLFRSSHLKCLSIPWLCIISLYAAFSSWHCYYLCFSLFPLECRLWKETCWFAHCCILIVVVRSLSHVWVFETPWTEACQASLSFTVSQSLLKLMCIDSVMPSNHLILCRPLLLLPTNLSSIRVFFKWVSSSHQVAKVLEL